MNYTQEYKKGHLVLPSAMLENFSKIFPSADSFLIWLYFFENLETATSEIAKKSGKSPAEINKQITDLQNAGLLTLNVTTGLFDCSPAFELLDSLYNAEKQTETASDRGVLQEMVEVFEQEMGTISPMTMEELRIMLFEDEYDSELMKEALKEAVLNRKVSLNYIKAILKNWQKDGIKSPQDRKNRDSYQAKDSQTNEPSIFIPIDGPWNGK